MFLYLSNLKIELDALRQELYGLKDQKKQHENDTWGLRNELAQKIAEIESMRGGLQDAQAALSNLQQTTLPDLKQQLRNVSKDKDLADQHLEDANRRYALLQDELDRAKAQNLKKDDDLKVVAKECSQFKVDLQSANAAKDKLVVDLDQSRKIANEEKTRLNDQLNTLRDDISNLGREKEIIQKMLDDANAQLNGMSKLSKDAVDELKKKLEIEQQKTTDLNEKNVGLDKKSKQLENELSNLRAEMNNLSKNLGRVAELEKMYSTSQAELAAARLALGELKLFSDNNSNQLSLLQAKIELYESELHELRQIKINLGAEVDRLMKSLADLHELNDIQMKSNESLQDEVDRLMEQNRTLIIEKETLNTEYVIVQQTCEDLRADMEAMRKKYEDLNEELDEMDDKIKEYEESIEASKKIMARWSIDKEELLDENMRLKALCAERIQEIEKLSHNNSKLLLKYGLVMCELERQFIHNHGDTMQSSIPLAQNRSHRRSKKTKKSGLYKSGVSEEDK